MIVLLYDNVTFDSSNKILSLQQHLENTLVAFRNVIKFEHFKYFLSLWLKQNKNVRGLKSNHRKSMAKKSFLLVGYCLEVAYT